MIEFIVPMLPPKECSPNWRGHWSARMRASRAYKEAVYYCSYGVTRPEKPYEHAQVNITCVVAEDRIRDADNWHGRFKPGMDALVAAGIIAYDDVNHINSWVEFEVDKDRAPATIIKVQEDKMLSG